MAVQEVNAISGVGVTTTRWRPGGLETVPNEPPARDQRGDADALALLTVIAEHLADLDLDGMLADISRLFGAPAALVSGDGAVLAGDRFAVPSPERLRAASRSMPAGRTAPPRRDTALPVRDTTGAVLAYLCLDGGAGLDNEIWPMLGALLAAAASIQLDRRDHVRRAGGDFLLSLLFAGDDFPESELLRWARQVDMDLAVPARAAFLSRAQAGSSRRPLEQGQRLRDLVTATVGPALLADVSDGVVCLCTDPVPQPSRNWVRTWERILPHLAGVGIGAVSVGGAFCGVPGVRRSYRQARSLAERQRRTARVLAATGVSVYEEGGVTEIVLGHPDSESLKAYVQRVLGPLLDHPRFGGELAETLEAYLATGGSPAGAAEFLHLHPSSVKYRMRVIRELLGGDELGNHDRRFELELALRMVRTFRELADGSRPRRTNEDPVSSRRVGVAVTARP